MRAGRACVAALIRLAGGEPAHVLPLLHALARQSRGQRRWAHAREGGGGLGPDGAWWLTLAILVLVSGGLALLAGVQVAHAPWRAALVLLLAQFGAVSLVTARDAVPLLLDGADRQVIGWWPVRERDLLLARGGLLLRGVLQVSLAVAGLPLLALVVAGGGGLAVAVGTLIGLVLHGLVLAALLVLGLHAVGRLIGLQRARRLVEILGVLLLLGLSNLGGRPLTRLLSAADVAFSWQLLVWPTAWFAAWPLHWPPQAAAGGAVLLSLVASAALPAWGLRLLGRAQAAGNEQPAAGPLAGPDWTRPVAAWTSLWLRGRDGRSVVLLLRAHLRADWRLASQLAVFPPLLLGLFWLRGGQLVAGDLPAAQAAANVAGEMAFFAALLSVSLAAALTFSGEATAAWLPHGAVLDGPRLLVLHRRLVRALVGLPFVTLALGLQLSRGDVSLVQAPAVALLGLLACELACLLVQWVRPAAPFSRAWRRGESAGRQVTWLVILLWPAHALWQELVLGRLAWGLPLTIGVLVGLLALGRWSLARRTARLGLYGFSPQVA